MSSESRRNWFSFRLRTLLLVVLVTGGVLAPFAYRLKQARDQRRGIEWVLSNGGMVEYKWQRKKDKEPPGSKVLRKWFGDDLFQSVHSIHIGKEPRGGLGPLTRVAKVPRLSFGIWGGRTGYRDLTALGELAELRELQLCETQTKDLSRWQN